MCDESWIWVINIQVLTLSKAIDNLIRRTFIAAIGIVAGLFDTSNNSVIYWKQFKSECSHSGLRRGVWFVYIHPEGGEAPPEPSQASDFEDVYANSFSFLQGRKRDAGACNYDHNAAKREVNKASFNNGMPYKPNISNISY